MSESAVHVRPLSELDLDGIVRIDERTRHRYQPDLWEDRVTYYLRRDPEGSLVAEVDGKVVGFMLGDVRAGEFGLEETDAAGSRSSASIPTSPAAAVGRALAEAILEHFRAGRRPERAHHGRPDDAERRRPSSSRLGFELDAAAALRQASSA